VTRMSKLPSATAIILHFHAKRKVDDNGEIEWIERKPVVLLLDDFEMTDTFSYLLDSLADVEHISRAELATHQREMTDHE